MNEPRAVFSKQGLIAYIAHLHNIEEALFFLLEHASGLDLSDEDLTTMYGAQDLFRDTKWLNRVLD